MKDKTKIVIKLNESNNMAVAIGVRANTKHVVSDDKFIPFVNSLVDTAIENKVDNLTDLEKTVLLNADHTVQEAIDKIIAEGIGSVKFSSIQPKIFLDDLYILNKSKPNRDESTFGIFTHNHIGAIVEISGADKELAKNIAIQIVGTLPRKSDNEKTKIIDFSNFLDQSYFKEPKETVGSILKKSKSNIIQFARLEMGTDVIAFNADKNYSQTIFQSAIIVDSISPSNRKEKSIFDVRQMFDKICNTKPYNKDKILSILTNYNISHADQDGESLLSLAVSNQTYDLTKALLESGANVNNLNPESIPEDLDYYDDEDEIYYKNPLHLAIESNNHEIVKLLLSFSANTYELNDINENCLTAACRIGNIEIILSLMKSRAASDTNTRAEMRNSPEKYDKAHIQMLLSEEELLDTDSSDDIKKSILEKIKESEHLKNYSDLPRVIEAIRFIDFEVDLTGGNADDKTEVMIIEFDDNNNKTYRLEYMYMFNWSYGDNIVKLKLFDGQNQSTIINHANDHNINEDASFALDKLMDLAKKLHVSYLDIKGFCYFLKILLSRMIQKDYFRDNEETLDEILEYNNFICHLPESNKSQALYQAVDLGYHNISTSQIVDIIDYLVGEGAYINTIFGRGWTPLIHAVEQCAELAREKQAHDFTIIESLLSHGADINFEVPEGYLGDEDWGTALGTAVHMNDIILVKYLLDKGANLNTENPNISPLEVATSTSFDEEPISEEIIKLLRERGAK